MTKKQKVFIDRYFVHRVASRAAIEAGYSEKTSRQLGYSLLKKPGVRKAIEERLKEVGQEL